ncbi:ABC transporter permease subunit, partial [Stenotrophomonas maltophilia]|uniref:ABC transporter permease subunit n=1 Tax=Stenotrophomonas maltophilia TaxID=40324 RepID=UPI0013DD6AA5
PLDATVSRFVDILMAFPLFVLAMAMVAALGNTVINVVYATAVINLPFYIRLARAEVSVRRDLSYVAAAQVGGSGHWRILTVFLLPNIM